MRKLFSIILPASLLTATGALAQTTSLSPYSRYGIGDLNLQINAAQTGMGGLSTGFAANNFLNLSNPAANAFLEKPVFDFATKTETLTLSSSNESKKLRTTYINHFAYAFPVKNKFCFSVGLVPYSRIGYSLTASETINDSTSASYQYKGSGGINRAFVGSALKLFNRNDSTVLSVGFNMNYMFGSIKKEARVFFPSSQNYFDAKEVIYTSIKDLAFDLGAYFSFYPNRAKSLKVNVGASYGIGTQLKTSQEQLIETFYSYYSGTEYAIDTVLSRINNSGSIDLPSSYSIGASVVYKNKWVFGADYRSQNWSGFSQNLATSTILASIKNSSQFGLGIQFTPKPNPGPKANFFTLINYRVGFRGEKGYAEVKGMQLAGTAWTAGIGVPFKRSNSLSRINVSYELLTRGTTNNGLLQEKYGNLVIGISIAPNNIDRWFYKRKYD